MQDVANGKVIIYITIPLSWYRCKIKASQMATKLHKKRLVEALLGEKYDLIVSRYLCMQYPILTDGIPVKMKEGISILKMN
nr:hypothetical protein [uncultured Alistipes sp.]